MVGVVVDSKLATLYELQTIYNLEDLYDLYEIIVVKIANEQKKLDEAEQKRKTGRRR